MAARAERDALRPEGDRDLEAIVPEPLVSPALDAADAVARRLEANGLDGRDLNDQANGLRRNSPLTAMGGALRMAQFLPLLPVFLLSMGVQSTLGLVKGNSTDEGVDARTTYQFVFALFASMICFSPGGNGCQLHSITSWTFSWHSWQTSLASMKQFSIGLVQLASLHPG